MPAKSKKGKPARRKPASPKPVEDRSITIGDISGGVGIAIGDGAQSSVINIERAEAGEIEQFFHLLNEKAAKLPDGPEKTIAGTALKELESEAKKGEMANKTSVQKWMKFLSEAAPDIWEVAVNTFIHPIKGLGTIFSKIAERSKGEGDAREKRSK